MSDTNCIQEPIPALMTRADELHDEYERLIHVACAKRQATRGAYVSPKALEELDAAVRDLTAFRANLCDCDLVAP